MPIERTQLFIKVVIHIACNLISFECQMTANPLAYIVMHLVYRLDYCSTVGLD